jgi:hypothetical protein
MHEQGWDCLPRVYITPWSSVPDPNETFARCLSISLRVQYTLNAKSADEFPSHIVRKILAFPSFQHGIKAQRWREATRLRR